MGRPLKQDLTGTRINMLHVLRRLDEVAGKRLMVGQALWVCKCDCGKTCVIPGNSLNNGRAKSCGCLRRAMLTAGMQRTHGMTGTPVYRIWCGMKNRCHNPNQPHYPRYGGRGIYVCDEWRNSFEAFYRDMGDRPTGPTGKPLTIERIDNNGPYCKENCKWLAVDLQHLNKRPRKKKYATDEERRAAKKASYNRWLEKSKRLGATP